MSSLSSAVIDSSKTAFFVPGVHADDGGQESAYEALRDIVRAQIGFEPKQRRIASVDCRFEGRDCRFEVGGVDPETTHEILAIIDVGGEQPFCVCTTDGSPTPRRLGRHAYDVTVFDRA